MFGAFIGDIIGSKYEFEIIYHDGESSEKNTTDVPNFLQLIYDSVTGNDVNYDNIIYKEGTGEWKTVTIKVDDINLLKGANSGYDFKLSATGILPAIGYYADRESVNPVRIHSVKITKDEVKNPLLVVTSTDKSGNAFAYYDNNKVVTNTYKNVSGEEKELTVITKLVDSEGVESFKNQETLTIGADERKVSDIVLSDFEKCGVFNVIVEVKSGEEIITTVNAIKIAVLKTDPNGVKDNNIFLSLHSERYSELGQETAADILDLMNVAGSRVSIEWADML